MAEGNSKIQEDDEYSGRVKEISCQPCLSKDKRTVADKFCSTCNEFQCTDCSNVHNILTILKSHDLMSANEAYASRYFLDLIGSNKCDQHQEIYKFFCKDESKLCCSTCAFVYHRKCHSIDEIENIAKKMTSSSSTLHEKLKKALKDVQEIDRKILTTKDHLAKSVNLIPVKIGTMRFKVKRMFDDLETPVVERAKALEKETFYSLSKKQSQNEKHLNDVASILETIDNVYKNGTPAQKFIANQTMENEVNVLCRKVNEECRSLETVTLSFHFDNALKLPPLSVFEYVPGQLILESHRHGDVKSVNAAMTLTPVYSIDLKKTGCELMEPLYTGIDFLPDGRLVAVDNSNEKFLIYNEKLEKVRSYQLSYPPLAVVAVYEDEVAITSGNYYEIDFRHVNKCKGKGSRRTARVSTKYSSICVKDNNKLVVGTIGYKRPVEIVSLTGQEYVFNINFPKKAYPSDRSACTYIRNSDKVVLTDTDDHTVNIYDNMTDTRVVVKDDQILRPCGVAVGPFDTILVCSKGTNSIVQISQTGYILSSHKIDMELPYKLCVSCDNSFLVVTNYEKGSRKMQKFKIS